ncbi:MAG TPA: sterol desaturase family protein, partial [Burkholderiales bacterium]|nr:sterol desaturase family protein [Burkholderiales bacterium]
WHRSARADYRLYFVNALLFPALFGFVLFSQQDFASWLDRMLGFSVHGSASASLSWKFAYTLAFFAAYDFGRFVAHSMLHDIPVLWEFHKVHHSAQVLTPITAYRAHPVDLLVMTWGGTTAVGLVSWGFNHLAGGVVDAYLFLGLHVLIWISNLIGNLRHTPVWMTYGPVLGKWLVSPAHHQIHHSLEARHLGCNRGFDLAIWDRLYGTLYVPTGHEEKFSIGLDDGTTEEWQSVRSMLLRPFAGATRILFGLSGQR